MEPDLTLYENLLEKKREEILDSLEVSKESVKPVTLDQASVGRLSRMDAMQAQAMAMAIEQRRKDELIRIGSALKRIEAGEYGECIKCEEPIAPKRLELIPTILTCIECAEKKG